MRRCIELARLGEYYVAPNPMVGAVLVDADGKILSEGWHQCFGGPHAEVNCLAAPSNSPLKEENAEHELRGAEHEENHSPSWGNRKGAELLFVSLEPCSHYGKTPPCADLIIEKGIRKVVVGCLDPNPQVAGRGVRKLREAGIEVVTGVLEQECRDLNKRFICLQEKHRPYVILKWAQTTDGVMGITSASNQGSTSEHGHNHSPSRGNRKGANRFIISNPLTKQIVHKMRAENMAILVGTNTALLDNPKLLTTHWSGRNPVRILLDRHHRVPTSANIFSPDAETIVYADNTEWQFILSDLALRNIHSVMVEGGAQVLQSIIGSGIYDELHVEVSPQVLGTPPADQTYIYAPTVPLPAEPTAIIHGNRLYEIMHPTI